MHADLLNPSRFMKAAEFKGRDVTFTIAEVELQELERDDNSKELKGIITFAETPKLLVINKTNQKCLKAMFGVETETWKGKRVTFFPFPMKDPFTKEPIVAIRLRGSPDIKAPVSVEIKLRKRKAQTMTMQITRVGVGAPEVTDQVEVEKEAIREAIRATPTPADADAAWSSGIAGRIGRLPLEGDRMEMKKFFSAHKGQLERAARAGGSVPVTKLEKPADDPPPPSEDAPAAA